MENDRCVVCRRGKATVRDIDYPDNETLTICRRCHSLKRHNEFDGFLKLCARRKTFE